jgi:hypothetical protein
MTQDKTINEEYQPETRTHRFAQWLMDRESKRQDKESNLEGMMRFNIFLSTATLVAVAGSTITNYLLMAYSWF